MESEFENYHNSTARDAGPGIDQVVGCGQSCQDASHNEEEVSAAAILGQYLGEKLKSFSSNGHRRQSEPHSRALAVGGVAR